MKVEILLIAHSVAVWLWLAVLAVSWSPRPEWRCEARGICAARYRCCEGLFSSESMRESMKQELADAPTVLAKWRAVKQVESAGMIETGKSGIIKQTEQKYLEIHGCIDEMDQ